MSTEEIRDKLADAIEALHEEQGAQAAEWRNLWVALGRALSHLESGNIAAARAALVDAEGLEYSLLGDCDITGAIVQAIDGGAIKEDDPS